jgi:hypothetical protein
MYEIFQCRSNDSSPYNETSLQAILTLLQFQHTVNSLLSGIQGEWDVPSCQLHKKLTETQVSLASVFYIFYFLFQSQNNTFLL